jgi:hypothetical protein
MSGVGWHSQFMDSFPRSNANARRIELRTLLGEFLTSLFGALKFFVSEAFGSALYQVACMGRRHVSLRYRFRSRPGIVPSTPQTGRKGTNPAQITRVPAGPTDFCAFEARSSAWGRACTAGMPAAWATRMTCDGSPQGQ